MALPFHIRTAQAIAQTSGTRVACAALRWINASSTLMPGAERVLRFRPGSAPHHGAAGDP